MTGRRISLLAMIITLAGCAHTTDNSSGRPLAAQPAPGKQETSQHQPTEKETTPKPVEINGVRVDLASRSLEFDGFVPIDAGNPSGLFGSMELFVCSGDGKSHESLVQAAIRPSDLHAALLLIGAEPGSPASFDRRTGDLVRTAAAGTPLDVAFRTAEQDWIHPSAWLREANTGERLPPHSFVFAGSREMEGRGYLADGEGILIALVTFPFADDFTEPTPGLGIGIEPVAWPAPFSESQDTDPMLWEPDGDRVPELGTPVTVRIEVAG